jgi:hypothetical protein
LWTEKAITATPHDHSDRAATMLNLGLMLQWRFERTEDFDNLQRAIVVSEEAVAILPLQRSKRLVGMNNLGGMLGVRFQRTGDFDDHQQAVFSTVPSVRG